MKKLFENIWNASSEDTYNTILEIGITLGAGMMIIAVGLFFLLRWIVKNR